MLIKERNLLQKELTAAKQSSSQNEENNIRASLQIEAFQLQAEEATMKTSRCQEELHSVERKYNHNFLKLIYSFHFRSNFSSSSN